MRTFAQILDGRAHNVIYGDDQVSALKQSFAADFIDKENNAGRPWLLVPDGTKPNDTTDGKGNWQVAQVQDPSGLTPAVDPVCARLDRLEVIIGKIADKLGIEGDPA